MISNPIHGWCDFNLGNFHGTPSYLTDVPLDLLGTFIQYFKNGNAVCSFDEEGSEFLLVLDRYTYSIFIIEMRESTKIHDLSELKKEDLAAELCNDIEKDLDGWQYFTTWTDDPEAVRAYRDVLQEKIGELRKILDEKESKK